MLQADSSRVRVAVRIRPLSSSELRLGAASVVAASQTTVTLVDPVALEVSAVWGDASVPGDAAFTSGSASASPVTLDLPRRVFTFDHVYHPRGCGTAGVDDDDAASLMASGAASQQERVFADVGARALDHVWRGWNASVLAYGQTGSGKSYTMLGAPAAPAPEGLSHAGVIPRLCEALFQKIEAVRARQVARAVGGAADDDSDAESASGSGGGIDDLGAGADTERIFSVTVSYCEIYCERVRDLLAADTGDAVAVAGAGTTGAARGGATGGGHRPLGRGVSRASGDAKNRRPSFTVSAAADAAEAAAASTPSLRVREHPTKGVFVEGLRDVCVESYADIERLLVAGSLNRAVASTRANAASSRSHALFSLTLHVRRADVRTGVPLGEQKSRVVLVDLAGSERGDHTSGSVSMGNGVGGAPFAQGAAAGTSPLSGGLSPPAQRSREMAKINTSLSALGAVIKALAAQSAADRVAARDGTGASSPPAHTPVHIPYRNSVLTHLLKVRAKAQTRIGLMP